MKLRVKITVAVMAFMIVIIMAVETFTYYKSNSIVVSQSESSIQELTDASLKLINSLIDREKSRVQDVATWADVDELLLENNSEQGADQQLVKKINEQLFNYTKNSGNIESSSIIDNNGKVVANSSIALAGENIASSDYFKKAQKDKKTVASDIVISRATGASVIMFLCPVIINGQVVGYVSNTVISETLLKPLENLKVLNTKSGYAYVTDQFGIMIYHPTKEKIGKQVENTVINNVVGRLKNGEKVEPQSVQYDFNDSKKFASYTIVPETNWILTISADVNEVQEPVRKMSSFILILEILSIAIACLCIFLMIYFLTKPLDKITELVNKTAKFNLTHDDNIVLFIKRKDEIGIIARSMENMIGALRKVVGDLKKTSEGVNINSNRVLSLTEKMYETTQDNSATTQQLSAGMEETAASSEEITSSVDEMEEQVKLVVSKTEEGAKVCQEIYSRAQSIKDSASDSICRAKEIYNETKSKMESAIEEANNLQQINVLADAILNITSQTNMLALNAAIEAARAGEAGKGFAVVADQIRSLAEQSSKTAADIQRIVKMVNGSVGNITQTSGLMLEFVDRNVLKDYDNLIDISDQYSSDADTMNKIVSMYNKTANDLSTIIENISTAIREVVKTSYESAQGVQDIASKTTEIVYSSEEIEKTAKQNTESAELLESIVNTFSL